MRNLLPILTLAFILASSTAAGQRSGASDQLSNDLCGCLGGIDLKTDDHSFGLALKHCLNKAVMEHPAEVLTLLHRYPDERQKAYLLGLLIGGTLERNCSQYPAVKERLRSLDRLQAPAGRPST